MNGLSRPNVEGSPLLLENLLPLFAEARGIIRQSLWSRHSPFARWVLLTTRARRAAGEGEAFTALEELAHEAGLTTEWGSASGARVDLLVLDGLWDETAAAAVRARWQPQLASGATVLVHGINQGEGGAPLWACWLAGDPLAPRFTFEDGAGLGVVLCAGAPSEVQALCSLQPRDADHFRALCAALGASWTAKQQEAVAAMTIAELRCSVDGARSSLDRLRRQCSALMEQVTKLEARGATLIATVARKTEDLYRQSEAVGHALTEADGPPDSTAGLVGDDGPACGTAAPTTTNA